MYKITCSPNRNSSRTSSCFEMIYRWCNNVVLYELDIEEGVQVVFDVEPEFIMNLFNYNLIIYSLFAFKRIVLEKMNKQQYGNSSNSIIFYEYIPKQQPHKYFQFCSIELTYFKYIKYLARYCNLINLCLSHSKFRKEI